MSDSDSKDWWSDFYDLKYATEILHSDDNIKKEIDYIQKVFSFYRVKSFFDQCCGIGDISIPLIKKGYLGYGIDQSKDYINYIYQQLNLRDRYLNADAFSYVTPKKVDAVINWHTSFGYSENDSDNLKMLINANRSLNKNGVFILDYINFEKVLANFKDYFEQNTKNNEILKRYCSINNGMLFQDWELYKNNDKIWNKSGRTKIYLEKQIKDLLSESGFEILAHHGDYDLTNHTQNSNRSIFLCKKTKEV